MDNRIFIISEAGVNHNGSLDLAIKLVEAAAAAGVDAVKFQTFKAEKLVTKTAPKAEYQAKNTGSGGGQYAMLKKLELDKEAHRKLFDLCGKNNLLFLSTPFDGESAEFLNGLGMEIFKIPSGEITNLPYLRKIAKFKKRILISTGMADMGEIEDALDVLIQAGAERKDITVLHCNTQYPAPIDDVNLKAMQTIGFAFGVQVGYSDHTEGIAVPIAAAALGARVIEKHFTLDKNMDGPDHKASLEPSELTEMVVAVRNVERALGNGIKKPTAGELENRQAARKSIVAARDIKKGEIFSENNLMTKRSSDEVSPMIWDSLVGRPAPRDFVQDEAIIVNDNGPLMTNINKGPERGKNEI